MQPYMCTMHIAHVETNENYRVFFSTLRNIVKKEKKKKRRKNWSIRFALLLYISTTDNAANRCTLHMYAFMPSSDSINQTHDHLSWIQFFRWSPRVTHLFLSYVGRAFEFYQFRHNYDINAWTLILFLHLFCWILHTQFCMFICTFDLLYNNNAMVLHIFFLFLIFFFLGSK